MGAFSAAPLADASDKGRQPARDALCRGKTASTGQNNRLPKALLTQSFDVGRETEFPRVIDLSNMSRTLAVGAPDSGRTNQFSQILHPQK
jgi:hypothetical protein